MTKTCSACFLDIDQRATRCPHCTTQVSAATLVRDDPRRVAAGVCAAVAARAGCDPLLVRLLAVGSLAIAGPLIVWLYLMVWLLTPRFEGALSPAAQLMKAMGRVFDPPASVTDVPPMS